MRSILPGFTASLLFRNVNAHYQQQFADHGAKRDTIVRTGLESFPSSGSSTRKRPLEKRGRSRRQKSHTTYAILRGGRFTLPRKDPRQ